VVLRPRLDAHVKIRGLHIMRGVAVEEGTFTGSHDGVLQSPADDVPPTGCRVTVDYIQVLRLGAGRYAPFNLTYDRLLFLDQLGLIPASA
jgi:hypothetical protein